MELIKIQDSKINGVEVNSINARDLHSDLKVKTKFADWIRRAVEKYDFEENLDYTVLKKGNGNNAFIDYIVTLDMAKELAILENNPKGKEYRKYFINFEKKAKVLIKEQSSEIELLQGMLNTISKMDKRVANLEQSKAIDFRQQKELQDLKNEKVYSLAKNHDLLEDKEMIRKLHSRVWSALKKRYHLPRYNELRSIDFESGRDLILSLQLRDLI